MRPTPGQPSPRISDPAPGGVLIQRHAALQRLAANPGARLVIVHGPAGYGKTTLLRQYSAQRDAQGDAIAWMRMDTHVADVAEFLRLLIEAAAHLLAGENSLRAIGRQRAPSLQQFRELCACVRQRGILVIDNFDQVGEPALQAALVQVLRQMPTNLQLCIGTRALPPAELARLRIAGHSVVIGTDLLRFDALETSELFGEFKQFPSHEVTRIHTRTGGWAAALQCFRLCLREGLAQRADAYAGEGITPTLMDFLASEVYEQLGADQQKFLLAVCIPETINQALADHLCAEKVGAAMLQQLEQAGVFLTRVDMRGDWFRFHDLFRQFLISRLRREIGTQELALRHRRIAQWYAAHGHPEQAIEHYLDAEKPDDAAQLLDSMIGELVTEGRLGLIENYANRLPLETTLAFENILKCATVAYSFRRNFGKASQLLDLRRRQLQDANASNHAYGSYNYGRIFLLAAQDRIQTLGQVSLEAAEQLDESDGVEYAVALNGQAMWLYARGEFEAARGVLLKARGLHDREHSFFGQSYQHAIYSMVLSAQGRIGDAIKSLSAALRRTEQEAVDSVTAGSVIAAYLIDGLYEQNQIAQAQALIRDYGQLTEQQAIVDPLAVMLIASARIAHLAGRRADAENELERMIYTGHRYNLARLVIYARAELVRQATLDDDLDLAQQRLRMLDPEAEQSGGGLIFHAGETEALTVTYARFLIRAQRFGEARVLLHGEIRKARTDHRCRREIKLCALQALSLNAQGEHAQAHRSLLGALELGMPGKFIRLFLDEGAPMLRLLKEMHQSLPDLPKLVIKDDITAYLEQLLSEAGEFNGATAYTTTDGQAPHYVPELLEQLTPQEKNILSHVARGLSNRELAQRLSVSTNTVKWHLRNIFSKLQTNNRIQAVSVARHFGLIE